jgi:hypothetical protein
MFTADQYRAKAIEYSELLTTANRPNEVREYQRHERSYLARSTSITHPSAMVEWRSSVPAPFNQPNRRPRKKPLFVVFCLIFAVSPSSAELA